MPTLIDQKPAFQFRKNPPEHMLGDLNSLLEYDREFPIPAMSLYEVTNSELFEDGSIFENKHLLENSLRDPKMKDVYAFSRLLRRRLSYKKHQIEGDVIFSLLDHWGHEYYHWFAESLPRLEYALTKLNNVTVVLSERYLSRGYITESLKNYPVKVEVLGKKQILRNKKIYYSTFPGPSDFHRDDLLQKIRARLNPDTPKPAFRKVYLSRAKARYRKITNEEAVFQLLEKNGFETVYAEDLSWKEQLQLFHETRVLVANHGAGLTNVLFMQPRSTVLEIRKNRYGIMDDGQPEPSKFYNTYYHMAQALGLSYVSLPAASPQPQLSCHYADVSVYVPDLQSLLSLIDKN